MVSLSHYLRLWSGQAAVGLIAFCLIAQAHAQPNTGATTNHHQNKPQTRTAPPAPPPPPINAYKLSCEAPKTIENTQLCIERQAADAEKKSAHWAIAQFWASVIGIGFVIGTLIFTARAAGAAGRSAEAAEGAITKSDELLEHSRSATETELRPYVFVDSMEWHWMHDLSNPDLIFNWRLTLHWKNMGRTPAKRVINAITFRSFRTGIPKNFSFPDPPSSPRLIGSMGPGHQIVTRIEIPLALMIDVWEKKRRLYYWAWIEYDDGFPNSRRRRTECCAEIFPLTDPAIKQPPQIVDAFIDRFNGADEDCFRQPYT